jgi:hypothetical protein
MSFKTDLLANTAKAAADLIPKGAEAAGSFIRELAGGGRKALGKTIGGVMAMSGHLSNIEKTS